MFIDILEDFYVFQAQPKSITDCSKETQTFFFFLRYWTLGSSCTYQIGFFQEGVLKVAQLLPSIVQIAHTVSVQIERRGSIKI